MSDNKEVIERQQPCTDWTPRSCETGCKPFSGNELRHHPDCQWYPESFSEMYDKAKAELTSLRQRVKRWERMGFDTAFRKKCPGYAKSIDDYVDSDVLYSDAATKALEYRKAFADGFIAARETGLESITAEEVK